MGKTPAFSSSNSSAFERSLLAARDGSSTALGQVLEACRAYLLAVARVEVQPDLQAKVAPSDLVQETCIEAQRSFERFAGTTKAELTAWLRAILLRRLQKAGRRFRGTSKRHVALEIPINGFSSVIGPAAAIEAHSVPPGSRLADEEQAAPVARAITRLPVDYQQVICLRNWELRSFAEIGKTMGRSALAARSLWFRAIERLSIELESFDG